MSERTNSTQQEGSTPIPGAVVLFLLVMLLFDGVLGWLIFNQMRVARFPTTPGVVEAVSLREAESADSAYVSLCPEVFFSYLVGNQTFQGKRLRFGGFCSTNPHDVERVMGDLAPGAERTVYYNPRSPAKAYLSAGIGVVEQGATLMLLPFNLFALGWLLEIFSRKVLGKSLEPDIIQFGRQGDRAWARFPHLGPIKFSLGVLLIVAFLISLTTIFFFAVLPERFFGLALTGLGALGVGLLLGKTLWNAARSMTTQFDAQSGELTLPNGAELLTVQIESWQIEEIRGRAKKAVYFRPVLLHREDDDIKQRAELPILSSKEEAYRFASWLVDTVGLGDR